MAENMSYVPGFIVGCAYEFHKKTPPNIVKKAAIMMYGRLWGFIMNHNDRKQNTQGLNLISDEGKRFYQIANWIEKNL